MLDELASTRCRVEALRVEGGRTRCSADAAAIEARLEGLLEGGADRFETLAGMAMGIERHARGLLQRALGAACEDGADEARSFAEELRAAAEAVGAAGLAAAARTFAAALSQGRDACEHEAVLARAELEGVLCTLRGRTLS